MRDIAILPTTKKGLEYETKILPFLKANGIEPVYISQTADDFFHKNLDDRVVLNLMEDNPDIPLSDEEKLIEWMTLQLAEIDSEKYEVLKCVNPIGEAIGGEYVTGESGSEFVNRHWFYSGHCINKHICGVVFWIFDKDKNLLLAERGAEKEQGAGKISVPSGHVQYQRAEAKEIPFTACLSEIKEELDLPWNYDNFSITDNYFPVGVIERPGNSGEGCTMVVKHFALELNNKVKEQIRSCEAKRVFFEPWDEAKEKFGRDDDTPGLYQFFGRNKPLILSELDRFTKKIDLLPKLGEEATWDTISSTDVDAFTDYKKGRDIKKHLPEGYTPWEILSIKEDLIHNPAVCFWIHDILVVDSSLDYDDMYYIGSQNGKVIVMGPNQEVITGREHTSRDFHEISVPPSELEEIYKLCGKGMSIACRKIPENEL